MADNVREFEELTRQLEKMEAPRAIDYPAGAKVDICAIWKTAKPIVEIGIKILRLLPFAWAKKLADTIEALAKALNALCP